MTLASPAATPLSLQFKRPSFLAALRLRCPYCRVESLRKSGSWVDFKEVCPRCHYRIEREAGYFTGATWMFNFPVTGVLAFVLVLILFEYAREPLGSLGIAACGAVFTFAFGIWFYPYSQSLWLYLEHRLRPLETQDFVSSAADLPPK